MKLTDLEPCVLGKLHGPNTGIAFNCPGDCCARKRELQARASELEARGAENAQETRMEAFRNQPFRIFVGWAPDAAYEQVYTRTGAPFDFFGSTTIKEPIDRTPIGHAKVRITDGTVTIL